MYVDWYGMCIGVGLTPSDGIHLHPSPNPSSAPGPYWAAALKEVAYVWEQLLPQGIQLRVT